MRWALRVSSSPLRFISLTRQRYIIGLALSIGALRAQPTITPSAVTLAPGQSIKFHSDAASPMWARVGIVVPGASLHAPGDPATLCAIGLKDCEFTAPSTFDPAKTKSLVRVYDTKNWAAGFQDATITFVASISSGNCSCKDGKDGQAAGDIFIVSSSPTSNVTFSRAPDGTWIAAAQISGQFLALVQMYRNGQRVQEKDISAITYANGKLIVNTKESWPASDAVSGTLATVNK